MRSSQNPPGFGDSNFDRLYSHFKNSEEANMALYTDEQRKVLEEMDAKVFGRVIYITELGTVIIANDPLSEKEILFDDFVRDLETKIDKEESAVKYDKENNLFYLVERDSHHGYRMTAHKLSINEEAMNNYAFGKYNKITSKINELYLRSMSTKEQKEMLAKKDMERRAIIRKMNYEHEMPTPAEARIYLDYLEELKKNNAKKIQDNTKEILKVYGIPTTALLSTSALSGGCLWIVDDSLAIVGFLIGGILGALPCYFAIDSIDSYVVSNTDYYSINSYVKSVKKEIQEKRKENKLIKAKIDKLNEIENVDKVVIAKSYSAEEFDKTVDGETMDSLNLKNSIMKNLDELVNRINLLNPEDKAVFFQEAQIILAEYTERYKKIINQDCNNVDIEADNYMKLKIDTLTRIADLETRVVEVRQKDLELKSITDESKLLTEKIEGFSQLDGLNLELQRTHNIINNKVKVKKLRNK